MSKKAITSFVGLDAHPYGVAIASAVAGREEPRFVSAEVRHEIA